MISIDGNLVIPNNSTLEMSTQGSITISGCVTLNGSLVINLQHKPLTSTQTINPIQADCFIGNISTLSVIITNTSKCQEVKPYPSIKGNILVIVTGANNVCNNYNSIIIGIVIGVFGLMIIVVILVMVIPSLRHKIFPHSKKPQHSFNIVASPRSPVNNEQTDL